MTLDLGFPSAGKPLVAKLIGRMQPRVVLDFAGERLGSYSLSGLKRRSEDGSAETLYVCGRFVCVGSEEYARMYAWACKELVRQPQVKIVPSVRTRISGLAERALAAPAAALEQRAA
jgi:hypothetical protein